MAAEQRKPGEALEERHEGAVKIPGRSDRGRRRRRPLDPAPSHGLHQPDRPDPTPSTEDRSEKPARAGDFGDQSGFAHARETSLPRRPVNAALEGSGNEPERTKLAVGEASGTHPAPSSEFDASLRKGEGGPGGIKDGETQGAAGEGQEQIGSRRRVSEGKGARDANSCSDLEAKAGSSRAEGELQPQSDRDPKTRRRSRSRKRRDRKRRKKREKASRSEIRGFSPCRREKIRIS